MTGEIAFRQGAKVLVKEYASSATWKEGTVVGTIQRRRRRWPRRTDTMVLVSVFYRSLVEAGFHTIEVPLHSVLPDPSDHA